MIIFFISAKISRSTKHEALSRMHFLYQQEPTDNTINIIKIRFYECDIMIFLQKVFLK